MDRHKTSRRIKDTSTTEPQKSEESKLSNILDNGIKEAFNRPWHRIERGLRLNRLRKYIEDISEGYLMSKEEEKDIFIYLQKQLDNKKLNTLKVVEYDQINEKIINIKGFEIKRNLEGILKYILSDKKVKTQTVKHKKL